MKPDSSGRGIAANVTGAREVAVRLALDADMYAWSAYLEGVGRDVAFCHLAWLKVFPQDKAFFLMAEREGRVVGILPFLKAWRGSYLRSPPVQSGTCLDRADTSVADLLLRKAFEIGRSIGAYKLSVLSPETQVHPYLRAKPSEICAFVVNVRDGIETVRERYSASLSRNLGIAARNSIGIEVLSDDQMYRFYNLYSLSMARIGTEPRPLSYFTALRHAFGDTIRFVVATVKGQDASGLAFLSVGRTVSMLYGGWEYELRKTYATSYLDDWTMHWAAENGYHRVDLGPSPFDESDGTYQYKKRFGCEVQPIYRHERWFSTRNWIRHRLSRPSA